MATAMVPREIRANLRPIIVPNVMGWEASARKRTDRRSTAHCRTGIGVQNTHAFLLQPGAQLLTS